MKIGKLVFVMTMLSCVTALAGPGQIGSSTDSANVRKFQESLGDVSNTGTAVIAEGDSCRLDISYITLTDIQKGTQELGITGELSTNQDDDFYVVWGKAAFDNDSLKSDQLVLKKERNLFQKMNVAINFDNEGKPTSAKGFHKDGIFSKDLDCKFTSVKMYKNQF